ncbi:MAG: phosphatase [Propionibacteriales bacterium]|nr:phosphatase [Propionibacteriales bacterium]
MTTPCRTLLREELRTHLVVSRIAGDVATSRENNLANFTRMSRRDPMYLFGLRPSGVWTPADVLALMAERCGVSPDPGHTHGQDTIDPDRTIERLEAMADRLRQAAQRCERVFVATGHPVGLRPTHTAVAVALAEAGCTVLTPASGWRLPDDTSLAAAGEIGYLDNVGALIGPGGVPRHTHSPRLMQAVLAHLQAEGEPPPDLVVADHGWAGAAGQAGVDAVGFADCNDPALFVGEAEGRVLVSVPLDDNVDPTLYAPVTRFLLDRAGLTA